MDPDASVADISIEEATQSTLQHAIDAMFANLRVPEFFDDFHFGSLVYAPAEIDDEDQSSSDGADAA